MRNALNILFGMVLCIGGCAGFVPAAVAAAPTGLTFSVLADAADYDSSEYRFGSVFDRESGSLSGSSLHAEYARGGWRFGLLYRSLSGQIDYLGQTQFGLPILSQTNLRYYQSSFSMTYEFSSLPVYVGLAWRTRKVDRYIEPTVLTQALHETLRQTEWGPILGVTWQVDDKLSADARIMALVTTTSTLSVDFLGTYDAGELSMPRNWSQEYRLSLRYQVNASYGFVGEFIHQQFSPVASDYALLTQNGTVVGFYYYPGSNQALTLFSAGVYVHW